MEGGESWTLGRSKSRLKLTRHRGTGIGQRETTGVRARTVRVVLALDAWIRSIGSRTIHVVGVGRWIVPDWNVCLVVILG